ncbi:unnamed protein product [Caenorhabditis brenneri]
MMNEDPQTTIFRLSMMHKDQLEHFARDLLTRFTASEKQRHDAYRELGQRNQIIGKMKDEFNEGTLKKEEKIQKLHEENGQKRYRIREYIKGDLQEEMRQMKNKIEAEKTNEIQQLKEDHAKNLAKVKASHQEEVEKTKKKMEVDAQL